MTKHKSIKHYAVINTFPIISFIIWLNSQINKKLKFFLVFLQYRKKNKKTSGIVLTMENFSGILQIPEEKTKIFRYYRNRGCKQ